MVSKCLHLFSYYLRTVDMSRRETWLAHMLYIASSVQNTCINPEHDIMNEPVNSRLFKKKKKKLHDNNSKKKLNA